MKKTILTLAMTLMLAISVTTAVAKPAIKGNATSQAASAMTTKVDSATMSGVAEMEKVRDKIQAALDDTVASSDGSYISIGRDTDMTAEDVKVISAHWASVVKELGGFATFGVLGLVLLVLLFRYLNRRRKYSVIEKAIENNYPLNELSLNDFKRGAIYVQQPVVTAAPQQPGQVPVGTPIKGQTPVNPIVVANMVNWRALMPAIRVSGWGLFLLLFGLIVCGGNDPFTVVGLALMLVGLCKGFILYMEQKTLQQAANRASQQMPPRQPMREGIPVPPPLDEDYKEDDTTYQPY